MRYPSIDTVGRALASLLTGSLLGALAGVAYAAVYGGVYWALQAKHFQFLTSGLHCAAGGAVLGLLVALCRAIPILRSSLTAPRPRQTAECQALLAPVSADDPRETEALGPTHPGQARRPLGGGRWSGAASFFSPRYGSPGGSR